MSELFFIFFIDRLLAVYDFEPAVDLAQGLLRELLFTSFLCFGQMPAGGFGILSHEGGVGGVQVRYRVVGIYLHGLLEHLDELLTARFEGLRHTVGSLWKSALDSSRVKLRIV